jgi:hypothetical protein
VNGERGWRGVSDGSQAQRGGIPTRRSKATSTENRKRPQPQHLTPLSTYPSLKSENILRNVLRHVGLAECLVDHTRQQLLDAT